jgi:hypothetical protein
MRGERSRKDKKMTNQEAAEIVKHAFQMCESEYGMTGEDWSEEHKACEMAVNALKTPAISLEFIEGYIKQLEKLDAPLAKNDINGIKTMVTAWKLSQTTCGPDYCDI